MYIKGDKQGGLLLSSLRPLRLLYALCGEKTDTDFFEMAQVGGDLMTRDAVRRRGVRVLSTSNTRRKPHVVDSKVQQN